MVDTHLKIKKPVVQDMEDQDLIPKPIRAIMIKETMMTPEKLVLGELKKLKKREENLKEITKY